ncbi:MAG: deiodinase [Planctomycetes bacterium]|nr:deiodinase [Planctomycetota bacterium]
MREAHALDSLWPIAGPDSPLVEEPATSEERHAVAGSCTADLGLDEIPVLVDDMEGTVDRAYEAWPDRLLLVDRDGRVAYRSGPGPFGFQPDDLEEAIDLETSGAPE